ncbi:hypothetical protein [Propionivibrio sp.]|uniref:hypothetical protein n=1 Tax=Propionivibrio sp. TaxID=2212460 RepID=UPI0025EDEA90|nr:hypothetical protein [Propionivibrio sp.]MBK7357113.1 hypothetical protein [Propionivibrio sp.]
MLTGFVAALAIIPKAGFSRPLWRNASIASTAAVLLALGWVQVDEHLNEIEGAEVTVRIFGTLQVFANPEGDYRSMLHGQIVHGRQHLAADKLDLPTTYYSTEGGAGKALQIKAASGPLGRCGRPGCRHAGQLRAQRGLLPGCTKSTHW